MPKYKTQFLSTPASKNLSGYINPAYKLEDKQIDEDEKEFFSQEPFQQKEIEDFEERNEFSRSPSIVSLPVNLEQISTREEFLDYLHEIRKQHALQLGELESQYFEDNPEFRQEEIEQIMQNTIEEQQEEIPIDFEDDFRLRFGYLSDKLSFEEEFEAATTIYSEPKVEPKKSPRPRNTIPEPFSFEEREKVKQESRPKSHEIRQPSRRFYSRPVPHSVKTRKFNSMKQAEEERKEYYKKRWTEVQQAAKERIEDRKKIEEMQKLESKGKLLFLLNQAEKSPPSTPFKASPVPIEVKIPLYSELLEKEKQRKQKIQERAKQLMQIAEAPHSLDAAVKRKAQVQEPPSPSFTPQINPKVPDFATLQQKFQIELIKRRMKPGRITKAKEFDLETAKIPSTKQKVLRDMKLDEAFGTETRWPFKSKRGKVKGTIPVYPVVPESKSTLASELKKKVSVQKLRKLESKEEMEQTRLKELEQKQKQMRKLLVAKLPLPTTFDNETTIKRKRQELKEQTKQYEESVKQTIKKLEQQRPMLFERLQIEAARRKAEKETEVILRKAGVDVDKINKKISQQKNQALNPEVAALTRIDSSAKKNDSDSDEEDLPEYLKDKDEEDESEEEAYSEDSFEN